MTCAFDRGCRVSFERERKAAWNCLKLSSVQSTIPCVTRSRTGKGEAVLGACVLYRQCQCEQSGLGQEWNTSCRGCSLSGIWKGTEMFIKRQKDVRRCTARVGSSNPCQRTVFQLEQGWCTPTVSRGLGVHRELQREGVISVHEECSKTSSD